ncbi:hypothetical protein [Actinomycetospora aeridis]|uniref:CBS domain-containing protein n=1 Tax=Actinomycetospora aeridis TaxID=3129231 RepID=A0ABU8N390_9PSEU
MSPRGVPSYATEGNGRIVGVLLEAGLLAEGGRESLRIADRLRSVVASETDPEHQADDVAEQLDAEGLAVAGQPETLDAARRIVEIVREGS